MPICFPIAPHDKATAVQQDAVFGGGEGADHAAPPFGGSGFGGLGSGLAGGRAPWIGMGMR